MHQSSSLVSRDDAAEWVEEILSPGGLESLQPRGTAAHSSSGPQTKNCLLCSGAGELRDEKKNE